MEGPHTVGAVLLLEFVDADLYRRYRFNEPWDGRHNRLLASEMPACFRSPNADPKSASNITDYVGIAGKDTPWQGTTPLKREDVEYVMRRRFEGKTEPIIWFIETAHSGINWMEPRDIPLERALVGINVPGGIQSDYSDGLPVWMLSGNSGWVPVGISPDAFRKMLTIAGDVDNGGNEGGEDVKKRKVPKRGTKRGGTKR